MLNKKNKSLTLLNKYMKHIDPIYNVNYETYLYSKFCEFHNLQKNISLHYNKNVKLYISWKYNDLDVIRTRNILICSQTR